MSRPRLSIGTHGKIHTTVLSDGRVRAYTRTRIVTGERKQIERTAASEAKAIKALKEAVLLLDTTGTGSVKGTTELGQLAELFMEHRKAAGRSNATITAYQFAIDRYICNIKKLTVAQATTARLWNFITDVKDKHGHGMAKTCRSVLSGMFTLAVREGALRANPVRDMDKIAKPRKKPPVAIPSERIDEFKTAIHNNKIITGTDLEDLILFMLATGFRVGEACGLRFQDINFKKRTVTMSGICQRVKGKGIVRLDLGKSDAATRTITIAQSTLEMLKERKRYGQEMVFPTIDGKLRDPSSVGKRIRLERESLGFPEITSHSFRKTVATELDRGGLTARDIADYLGQANPSLTQDVYMARNLGSEKAANIMQQILSV